MRFCLHEFPKIVDELVHIVSLIGLGPATGTIEREAAMTMAVRHSPGSRRQIGDAGHAAVGDPDAPQQAMPSLHGGHDRLMAEPPRIGAPYPVLLPQVDAEGNPVDGLRNTAVEAPLGTYTGWNVRKAGFSEGTPAI